MQIMTYDEHGPWGDIGPVSSLPWFKRCLDYALTVMPAHKISIGLPAYGYDWTRAKSGDTIALKDVPALLARTGATPQWDAASSSPWFTYKDSHNVQHTVWYENAQSLKLKVAYAKSKGVGVSVWALGLEDSTFWSDAVWK